MGSELSFTVYPKSNTSISPKRILSILLNNGFSITYMDNKLFYSEKGSSFLFICAEPTESEIKFFFDTFYYKIKNKESISITTTYQIENVKYEVSILFLTSKGVAYSSVSFHFVRYQPSISDFEIFLSEQLFRINIILKISIKIDRIECFYYSDEPFVTLRGDEVDKFISKFL